MNYIRTRTVRAVVYPGCALALLTALCFTPGCRTPETIPPTVQTATHAYWAPETHGELVRVGDVYTYAPGGAVR